MATNSSKKGGAKKARASKSAPRTRDPIDAMMGLVADHGWTAVDMQQIAEASGMTLGDLSREYEGKTAMLLAFLRRIDSAVLDGTGTDMAGENARDRLFDILMRRFDHLVDYKPAIERLTRDIWRDPLAALALSAGVAKSMAWMLAAAGLQSDGPRGILNVKGLSGLWLATMRTWLTDDTPDMSRTMAALDKNLARLEQLANSLPGGRRHAA